MFSSKTTMLINLCLVVTLNTKEPRCAALLCCWEKLLQIRKKNSLTLLSILELRAKTVKKGSLLPDFPKWWTRRMIRALSFCRAKRQYRYRPVFALVDVQPTGLYDSDSIPFKPNESTPKGVLSFGGLEGDRTLEPHGCEPCALPAELRAHINL